MISLFKNHPFSVNSHGNVEVVPKLNKKNPKKNSLANNGYLARFLQDSYKIGVTSCEKSFFGNKHVLISQTSPIFSDLSRSYHIVPEINIIR